MSDRRSRASRITDDDINDLVLKLQQLIPETRRRSSTMTSTSKILKETCNYIKSLHKEVEDLSEKLSDLLASMDPSSLQAEVLRSLLMQQ